ncbi:hypothetical protein [Microvirga terricola]|uniref:Uncharacterized protein n=1 Tax=Microvirga terricola TaxID=2719797 RepID=A0ABX0VFZ4_9HYPH|nr:hypothetical protein [Microvirga terricola]NIX77326.1 hypothetical protein [Microvirga terricola]
MSVRSTIGLAAFSLALSSLASDAHAAKLNLSAYQGAWLEQSLSCDAFYASGGKSTSFKKPLDMFAPAFIVSGNRLRTPQATCSILSIEPTSGNRQIFNMHCANSVSGNEVKVIMSPSSNGGLARYFNEQDTTGTLYRRCR